MRLTIGRLFDWLPLAVFGSACCVGVVGAFVGLGASSFWWDELFTSWVVGGGRGPPDVFGRALTDVHPPLYYLLTSLFTGILGDSDIVYRVFSSLCAGAAVVVFVTTTARSFSWPARLFGGAIATGSLFWFFQAQNARPYALALLICAAIASISLRMLQDPPEAQTHRALRLAALFALIILGAATHLYMLLLGAAVLAVLCLALGRDRLTLACMLVALILLGAAYVEFVLRRFTWIPIHATWIGQDATWYRAQLASALALTLGRWAKLALAICLASVLIASFGRWKTALAALARSPPAGFAAVAHAIRRVSPMVALCAGAPLLVLAGGVASSILFAPNFTDRNLLVASPLLWGLWAALYDAAVPPLRPMWKAAVNLALCVPVLLMSTIVTTRTLPVREPFREAASWIRTFASCRGADIPVVVSSGAMEMTPERASLIAEHNYGRYLGGFARPRFVSSQDLISGSLPTDLAVDLAQRASGKGCPVLAWAAHLMQPPKIALIASRLAAMTGASGAQVRVRVIRVYSEGPDPVREGREAFVVYAASPAETAGPSP